MSGSQAAARLPAILEIVGQIQHPALLNFGKEAWRLVEGGVGVDRQFVDGFATLANCGLKILQAASVDVAQQVYRRGMEAERDSIPDSAKIDFNIRKRDIQHLATMPLVRARRACSKVIGVRSAAPAKSLFCIARKSSSSSLTG